MNATKLLLSISFVAVLGFLAGCKKDVLDIYPKYGTTPEKVFANARGYYSFMAKVYGAYTTTGNQGPAGQNDIPLGGDEGFSDFSRTFWQLQELPTDEAIISWGDVGLPDFNTLRWSSGNGFIQRLYARSLVQIVFANEFIRESSDSKLGERGISGDSAVVIRQFREEARFLRAFQYWVLMDLWGNTSFVTETDLPGATAPARRTRPELFQYVESELKDLENKLQDASALGTTARASKGAAQALLARLYLNAGVYTGTERYADAATYAKKVIDGGYSLCPNYRWLFLADNNIAPATNEIIMAIHYDGQRTQSFGGTNFLGHASIGGQMRAINQGFEGGWTGLRAKQNLPGLFDSAAFNLGRDTTIDKRAMFFTRGQRRVITRMTTFTDGWAVYKWKNRKRDGGFGSIANRTFSDIDFPLFRLAEMHLIYAEAAVRGQADPGQALIYVNQLRRRAAEGSDQDPALMEITAGDLNLDFILNERGRELYWEGHRRTDLIRFDRWVRGYNWAFKNNVIEGADVDDFRKLYPLPSAEVILNPNLVQNPGY